MPKHARHYGHELDPIRQETRIGEQAIEHVGGGNPAHDHHSYHGVPNVTRHIPRR